MGAQPRAGHEHIERRLSVVAGDKQNDGRAINFQVGFTLANRFQAVGTMGFLQALITEPTESNPADHTGVTGNVSVALTGGAAGGALNGGMQLNTSALSALTPTPNMSLTMLSALQLAFGADFQRSSSPTARSSTRTRANSPASPPT